MGEYAPPPQIEVTIPEPANRRGQEIEEPSVAKVKYLVKGFAKQLGFEPTIHSFTGGRHKDRLAKARKKALQEKMNSTFPENTEVVVVHIRNGREIQVWKKISSGVA